MRSQLLIPAALVTIGCTFGLLGVSIHMVHAQEKASPPSVGNVLPVPSPPFKGTINLRAKDSKSDFPQPVKAPDGAPNILLVLLDDVGYGATSTFGGPCNTPTFTKLAENGLKYNHFHTTALCSPTRAALITGRNHHSVHTACIMEAATGFPGYDSVMQKDTATVAEILKQAGYGTAWFGKNHNVPDWQTSQAGPFDLWPTGLGFDHFYGFVGGDTNQWRPAVTEGTKPIDPYIGNPDYNFDYDMADQAIEVDQDAEGRRPGQAVLLLLRARRDARPAPSEEGVGREVQGQVRPGLGQGPRGDVRAAEEAGRDPGRREAHARAPGVQAWDALLARGEEGLRPVHGGLRRLPGTDRPQRRPRGEGDRRPGPARQHARHLHRRRQRGQRRREPARACSTR